MVMITCDMEGCEWEKPEGGSAPEKVQAGFQYWQSACAEFGGSPEMKWSIKDRKSRLP
jgi:hypothetical protein